MKLTPFEKITSVPRGKNFSGSEAVHDVFKKYELIDVASLFSIENIKPIIFPGFRAISAYLFDAHVNFGFNNLYELVDLSFQVPFDFNGTSELLYKDMDLMQPSSLMDVKSKLAAANIPTELFDIGLKAPEIGVSFFSNDFVDNLDVKLDGVTVHFNNP